MAKKVDVYILLTELYDKLNSITEIRSVISSFATEPTEISTIVPRCRLDGCYSFSIMFKNEGYIELTFVPMPLEILMHAFKLAYDKAAEDINPEADEFNG